MFFIFVFEFGDILLEPVPKSKLRRLRGKQAVKGKKVAQVTCMEKGKKGIKKKEKGKQTVKRKNVAANQHVVTCMDASTRQEQQTLM